VSGWMINIGLPLAEVQRLLEQLSDGQLSLFADGFSMSFPDGVVAYAADAAPEVGTDLTVKGPSPSRHWQIYKHLESRTPDDVVMWMMNDGAVFEAGRGTTAKALGL
jgi:hypothetical protein